MRKYYPEQILEALNIDLGALPAAAARGHDWGLGEAALEELVGLIPNDAGVDRDTWVEVAHGIYGAGGTFEIFDKWSQGWPGGYDPDETRRVWETLGDVRSGGGLLRARAEAADPAGFDWWKQEFEAKAVFDDGLVEEVSAGAPTGVFISPVQREVAESIFISHGERLRFNHDSGCWHKFTGAVWEPLPKSVKEGFRLAERWAALNAGVLGPADFKAVSKANFFDGVENILRQRLIIRQDEFDCNPWLLGCPGGTVDLRTGTLGPARAGDFISRCCAVTPLQRVDGCPRWVRFVREVSKGDLEVEWFLRQWLGYCLTGDTTEQMFLFLYGPGGNGKSVLMDTFAWAMGTYFVKPVADLYVKKTGSRHMQEVAMLAGARMVSVSEVPTGAQWDEGRLKEHTGGGRVTANFMRENSFSFVPQFKLTALGNHQPSFPGGINPAIRRRFKMLLMDFVPTVVDRKLEEVLRTEGPGILRWALTGLCDPVRGWHKVGLMIPKVVDDVTDEYVLDQDVFAAWLGDRVEKKAGATTAIEDMRKDWTEYRNAQGNHDLIDTPRAFTQEMDRRGFARSRTNTARHFRGIVLKSKAKEAFDD